jgi:hypothetical protein
MHIVITTLNREDKQKALAQIPTALHQIVHLYTKADRVALLQAAIPDSITVRALPQDTDGIAQTRQRAIDATPKGKVWIIDDLCVFRKRTIVDKRITYTPLDDDGFMALYERISTLLDRYIQVGISAQNGNNRWLGDDKPIGRAYSTYGLRTDKMQRAKIAFDAMYRDNPLHRYMEDFYITMDALTKGYPNIIIYDHCFQYTHNAKGGNSTNRTVEGHSASAQEMQRRFPKFIKTVKKDGDWGNGGMDGRLEIHAQWQKAFQSSKQPNKRK